MAGEALRLDAHEDRLGGREIADHQGHVLGLGVRELRTVAVDRELPELGRKLRGRDALDEVLAGHAVRDELLHRDDLQAVPPREALQLGQARHRSVCVRDLADHTDGLKTGESTQIHRCLGLSGAHEHAPFTRAQGEDVTGLDEIYGCALRIGEHAYRARAIGGADAGRGALARVDGHGERRPEARLVPLDHLR